MVALQQVNTEALKAVLDASANSTK